MPIMRPFNPWENGDPFATSERLESGEGFKLLQWPIKLWKISETAPYFHHAHLLVVADCAALSSRSTFSRTIEMSFFLPSRPPLSRTKQRYNTGFSPISAQITPNLCRCGISPTQTLYC